MEEQEVKERYIMKRGYYIHFEAKRTPGVARKINMQIAELQKSAVMEEIEIKSLPVSFLRRLSRFLPGGAIDRSYEDALKQLDHPDFIYVRRATADRHYVNFFQEVKRRWPSCKIIIEIFTYPYDRDEFRRLLTWPYYFKEVYNRKKLVGIVDRYVTYSEDDEIFGIPTIRTGNGIVVDQVPVPAIRHRKDQSIHLIAVAFMQKHHGYERLIKGLHAYYQNDNTRKVICHLIGDGPEKEYYRKLTAKYGLEDLVRFYPTTTGDALDRLYEEGDVAVSAIGVYKDGIDRENSLKTREYMAKGFPMVTGCRVDGLGSNYPYVCQFPNDATPIDICRVVDFYDALLAKESREEIQTTIRNYVKKIADMPVVIKPIVDYIEN